MRNNIHLILHQFRRENREHWWFIVGYSGIVAAFTALGATSILEDAKDHWGRPLLMDNEELYLFISLVPAMFFAPFLAFADPTDDPEAFWLTKPARASMVVSGKILWMTVWLIGMPLVGECITIALLGGGAKIAYVAVDCAYLRAAFVFSAFALGSVANHPLRLIIGVLSIPVMMEFIGAGIQTVTGNPLTDSIPFAAALTLSWYWIGAIATGAIGIALAQYRWRRPFAIGVPAIAACITITLLIERQSVDFSRPSGIAMNSPFAAVTVKLNSVRIQPGALTIDGLDRTRLTAKAVMENVPHSYTVGLVEWQLAISADGQEHRLTHLSGDWKRFHEDQKDGKRVFQDIIARIKNGPQSSTTNIHAIVDIPLSDAIAKSLTGATNISVRGQARLDCFAYHEFATLEPAPYNGPIHPPNNQRVHTSIERGGTKLTLNWPVAPGSNRQISIQTRRISASLDPDNEDPRVRSHNHVTPWYYILRNSASGECWTSYTDQYVEHYRFAVRSPIHLHRGWVSIPSSFNADEVIVFKARYVGQRTAEINSASETNL